jgi:hypothetical protein
MAPTWEIDPVALAAHARLSRRRRLARDATLQVLLLGTVVAEVAVATAGVVGAMPVDWVPWALLGIPLLGWLLALQTVHAHYGQVRDAARDVYRNTDRPAAWSAPPVAEPEELRLRRTHHSNCVMFRGFVPFAASGYTLDAWRLSVDISPHSYYDDAERARGLVRDLHRTLLAGPRAAALDLQGVSATRRLYVDGGNAAALPFLLPRTPFPARRPECIVDESVLDRYETGPTRAARTYCVFTKSAWDGDIVVTLFVRAEVSGRSLYVEGRSHVLLPLQTGFKDVAWVNPAADRSTVLGPTLRAALSTTTGLWLESVGRWLNDRREARMGRERSQEEGESVALGHPVHFGSTVTSLREEAQVTSDLAYYASVDEVMVFRTMTRQALDRIKEVVVRNGLTVGDLEEQREMVALNEFAVNGVQQGVVTGSASPGKGTPAG